MQKHKASWMYSWAACLLGFLAVLIFSSPGLAKEEEVVKVGVVAAIKHMMGQQTWDGAEMAAEEINAAGGIKVGGKAYKIELVKADSNEWASISDAVGAMERVITLDKVKMVMGGYRSEAVLAMQDVAAEYKTIYFSIGAGHSQIALRLAQDYEKYKYWFRGGKPQSMYGGIVGIAVVDMVANKFKKELGIEKPKVAMIAEKVLWADETLKFMKMMCEKKLGLEVVYVTQPSNASNDLRVELNAAKASGAHILIHLVSGPVGVAFGRQWGSLKIPLAAVGYNAEAMKKEYWKTTEGLCEYEALVDYVSSAAVNERSVKFWKNYEKKYNDYPMECALSYNHLYQWKESVEKAGTFDADKVIGELLKNRFEGPGGVYRYEPKDAKFPHDLVWAPDGASTYGIQWRKGEKKTIWPDGNALTWFGDPRWKGIRFKGTVDYAFPPWVVDYWKKNK